MNSSTSMYGVVCLKLRRAMVILATVMAVLLVAVPAFPQANQGTIQGSVYDQSGGAIVGATVTVVDVARGVTRTLTTDSAGAYVAPNLIPGTYTVRGTANGFQTLEHANISLEVGQTVRVDVVLPAGQQTQTVTVTSEAPTVNTTDSTVGGTLNQQVLAELPMNGRNFRNLMTLRPGIVVPPGGTGAFPGVSANGTRNEDLGYLIDGVKADEPYTGSSIVNSPTPLGDGPTSLPVDAIQEMNNQANTKAENGWKPGAVINMGLKSGTNEIHGTAFGFGRSDKFDARNYFDTTNLAKIPLTFGQYGGNIGGPIKKDKLFYFADYEGQRYSVGVITPFTTPATGLLPGGQTSSNVATSLVNACLDLNAKHTAISPLSAQIVGLNTTTCAVAPQNFTPGPGESFYPANPTGAAIYTDPITNAHQDNGVAKIDYRVNDHSTVNGMFFYGEGLQNGGPVLSLPNQGYSPFAGDDGARVLLSSGAWNWTPSSTRVNEFRFGYQHFHQDYQSYDHTVNPLAYGVNVGSTDPRIFGFPTVSITGFTPGFGGGQQKIIGPNNTYQLLDHYTILHGNHSFKFGGEFIENKMTAYQNSNGKGKFNFSNLEGFLTGTFATGGNAYLAGDPTRHLSNQQYALFAQDDWRVTRRVMLNLGLRWEYTTVLKEDNNLLGRFDPNVGLEQVGKQIGSAYNGDFKDFSPRVGVAWDMFGNGRTVLRGGGSIMYANVPIQMLVASGQLIGISQVPTGATFYTAATPGGVPGPGNMGVIQVVPASADLTANWQAQTAACVTGGTTACGAIVPQYALNIQCGDGNKYTIAGKSQTVGQCVAPSINPNFKNPYVITWTMGLQRAITNNLSLDVSYVGTHGDREAAYVDINEPALGSGFVPNPAAGISNALTCSYSATANLAANAGPGCGDPSSNAPTSAPAIGTRSAAAEQAARPFNSKFPYLSYIDQLSNPYRSNYNALQVTLTERVAHGLTFLAGYTWQHALDDDVSYNLAYVPADSKNPNLNYGTSVYDYRQRFTFTSNYQIPGRKGMGQLLEGWGLNNVITYQSRAPWGPTDLTNDLAGNGEVSNPGTFGQFWNFSGNRQDFNSNLTPIPCWGGASATAGLKSCALGSMGAGNAAPAACTTAASAFGSIGVATMDQIGCYIRGNSVLFPAALGTNGDVGRYQFRGATFGDWDLSVTKNWKFKEHMGLEFRADFFNIINHPIFAITVGTNARFTVPTTTTTYGCNCITPDQASSDFAVGTGGSRHIQLGMRFNF